MKSVTSGLINLLVFFSFKKGLKIDAVNSRNNIDERIPLSECLFLLEQIEAKLPCDALGLEIAKLVQPSNLGILGYIVLTCDSLSEALPLFLKYQRLCYDFMDVDARVSDNEIIISWEFNSNCKFGQTLDETIIGILLNFTNELIGPCNLRMNRVEFVSEKPKNIKPYTNFFDCPVEFNKKRTSIHFPVSNLEFKIYKADPYLNRILNNQAEMLLSELPEFDSFDEFVQKEMIKSILQGNVNIDNISKKIGMSSRKFQSKLKEHGYTFRERLNKVRRDLAFEYLEDNNLSILDISILLSYREQTSFIRAFKDWTGSSPLQYRKKLLK